MRGKNYNSQNDIGAAGGFNQRQNFANQNLPMDQMEGNYNLQ